MAGCNDNCNCYLEGGDGVEVDGLGSASEPYSISTDAGRHIPWTGTNAERVALILDDDDRGVVFYETDTGIAYVYDGTAVGWRTLSVTAVEDAASSVTLSAGASTKQTIASIDLGVGAWDLSAKFNLELAVGGAAIGWGSWIIDSTGPTILDQTDVGGVFTDVGTRYVPVSLQDVVRLTVASTIVLQVDRSQTTGTQLARHIKLRALSLSGARDF